jgi:hypothetical protein
MTHTPGPWRVIASVGIVAAEDCHVCHVGDFADKALLPFNKDRWLADARLIAGAPDLLAALERYATRYLQDERDDPALCLNTDHHNDVLAVFAAIAKARGGS